MNLRAPFFAIVLAACKREPAPAPAPRPRPQNTPLPAAGGSANPTQAPPPSTAFEPPAPATAFREAGQYLPQGAPLESWSQSGAVRIVNGQDLFQLIDGAGEKYMAYGFRQLARTDYRKAGTELVVTAEVYDMGSHLGAYGQYSMLLSDSRDPASLEAQAAPHGGGGFLGTSQLVFWKGQHLVQINLVDDSGERDENALRALAREALPPIAARIASALPGETTPPAFPAGMSRDGLVWGGATYLAQNVLGVERTGPAWVGHYRAPDGPRWRVAFFARPTEAEARAVVALFRTSRVTAVQGLGDEAFTAAGSPGEVAVARKGNTVVVVADPGLPDLTALPLAGRVERLRAAVAALP